MERSVKILSSTHCLCWLACTVLIAGCGTSTYEERLRRTADFYDYLQVVDGSLSPTPWFRQDLGMSMRLPRPFSAPMGGPQTLKDENGVPYVTEDPRQANPLEVEIPGLIDAWSATLDPASMAPDTFIYVVSNHDRFIKESEGGPPPIQFITDLEGILAAAFGVTIPDGETQKETNNNHYRLQAPTPNSQNSRYTTVKDYVAIKFVPSEEINDKKIEGRLYERKAGQVSAALLVIGPKSVLDQFQFRQRLDLALETWEVDSTPPRGARSSAPGAPSSSAPAPAPAGGTGGF